MQGNILVLSVCVLPTLLQVFKVIHDFSQEEAKFLSIKTGDILTLVDTIGENRGWWKGALNNRVGFFPLTYVKELSDEETP